MNPEAVVGGMRVRVIGNAAGQGTISAPAIQIGATWYVQVHYDDGSTNNTPLQNLEPLLSHRDAVGEATSGHFQGPEGLRRNLLHEKLSGRLSGVIYSMDASKTKFLACQFKPVLRLLESPTNSLLIADEVGLERARCYLGTCAESAVCLLSRKFTAIDTHAAHYTAPTLRPRRNYSAICAI